MTKTDTRSIRREMLLAGALLGFVSAFAVLSLVTPLIIARYGEVLMVVTLVGPATIVGSALGAFVANLRFGATTVASFVASLVTVLFAGLVLGVGLCVQEAAFDFERIERGLMMGAAGLVLLALPLVLISFVVAGCLTLVRMRLRRTR